MSVLREIAARVLELLEGDDELYVDELDRFIIWRDHGTGDRPLFASLFEHYGKYPRNEETLAMLRVNVG